jgi:hypothetical protein
MELFIVMLIVGMAAGYILKTFYRQFKIGKAGDSSCGCTSCPADAAGCGRPDRNRTVNLFDN